jgi:TolB-like protein/Tfp pilus assembly protein PilF
LYQVNIPGTRDDFPQPRIQSVDKRIAVMPFENLSEDADNEHFCQGIAEELIVSLGKIQGLRVISRSSSFAVGKEHLSPEQIGKKLNVTSVLEGRVRTNNGQMRISVELVDTESGLDIWSGQYDSPREEIFHMQDEIAREITEALECKLIPEQMNAIERRQTKNIEAYDFYLRGRRFYLQFSTRGMEHALQMFEKAIDADDTYALAYAGIADCYSYLYQHLARTEDIIGKADAASQKAVELAPFLGNAYASRGIVLSLQSKFEEAEKAFQTAIENAPSLFLGWFHYGRMCFTYGKLDKAARLFKHANRVEPDDYQSILLAAQVYDDLGSKTLAQTLRQRGVVIARKWLELNPGDTRALYMAANALAFLDESGKSLVLLKRALVLEPDDSMLLYNAGCVYAVLGMESEALNCLEKSYLEGLTLKGWYLNDSNLDSLREHPRYIDLLNKMTASANEMT